MKAGIHPTYQIAHVTCISCGNKFETGAVIDSITVEVCSQCHPFYTGKRTLVDTAGRVEKFKMKMQKKAELQGTTPKSSKKSKKDQSEDAQSEK